MGFKIKYRILRNILKCYECGASVLSFSTKTTCYSCMKPGAMRKIGVEK
jgi:hypothetical protein